MKTHVLTTTISHDMAVWLDQTSLKYKRTKRDILETALRKFREENIKKNLRDSFIRASGDKEVLEMTEDGAGDFWAQLNKLDKK